tara:strand:+ start:528 stop:1208 length:681 start_codon:yes stop_codon:yes gene_type:complete
METPNLDESKQKKYDEIKKKYLKVSKSNMVDKQILPQSPDDMVDSLEKQLKQKNEKLTQIKSKNILYDLNDKKQNLDNKIVSKQEDIRELRSNLQDLQKEITLSIKELRNETDEKITELFSTNTQLSQLITEENSIVENIQEAQKLRLSQEKELEELRLERLNIVNKNKDTQKIQEHIIQYRNRLDQITSDRAMLELEIKSQMNLLEEERQKEHDIVSRIIKQYKN